MTNPFDYVNDIQHGKKNLMEGTENDALAEQGYNPWLTNLALSYHLDTVLHANEINRYYDLSNKTQYLFLLNSVRPKKRQFAKWAKKAQDNEDLDMVCEVYECNRNVGKTYLSLLSSEQLDTMRKQREKGG